MKEIKFTTAYKEPVLSFGDEDFKKKYEERIGKNEDYICVINGEKKYLALCPKCNNPVAILGIYKKIDAAPHARHAKDVNIPNVVNFNRYKYEHCPYHRKKSNYIKEYVPEEEEPLRHELYKIAKENFDKAIYLLKKETGIYINSTMAEKLAENYAAMRTYNYIDATDYNIPWYLIYSFSGFPLHYMNIRRDSTLFKTVSDLGLKLRESNTEGYDYVYDTEGYVLRATDYRYKVDDDDKLNEWLDFSIIRPDDTVEETLLYVPVAEFSIKVDSYHFGNLINYEKWEPQQKLLDIAAKYMNP